MNSIELLSVSVTKTSDSLMTIVVSGNFPTSGWGEPSLSPRKYVIEPTDGILDFDVIADEPASVALQVITPFRFDESFPVLEWVSGVRIHAKNSLEAQFTTEP